MIVVLLGSVSLFGACADDAQAGAEVTLLTHDSFDLPQAAFDEFRRETGMTLKIVRGGDAGQLASVVSLTPGSPKADAVFGIDNTFASRPIEAGALEPYAAPAAVDGAGQYAIPEARDQLTAVDRGDVCLNIDESWYAERNITPPANFRDLADPKFAAQSVLMDPGTSSPGMAFLLTTIGVLGEGGWQSYWQKVVAGGAEIVPGWEEAYNDRFTAGTNHGDRPIVLSYASSPAATAGTKALLDNCFRQIEYIGILKGTRNPDGARKLVDFMLSPTVQKALPSSMFVYPVQRDTPLPDGWQERAPLPSSTVNMPPRFIAQNFEKWLDQWRTAVGR
ncbi:thiamine ABC transporter substrate-binding protein [Gordonia sp. ABSL1-1]|uniref:thiamine ABC transporter substrate-binding protein n=1 Tax=Gordonia sp. ABSL1-1 TaxID=3053923 RepID=UPI00257365E1|nr:thiamine ABC transporter substrate-binding protein [Gordonia sp. ABSL1-1]MDL9935690.1 thiamine ABC transporter substrate-binding protein [Gordonia sp. ABSL1-1]